MTDQNVGAAPGHEPPPGAQVMQLVSGCLISSATYTVAKLGIADLLADGPKTTAELAASTATDEHSLYRLLRATASVGLFTEMPDRTFANSPMSDTLRSDASESTRFMTLWMSDPLHWAAYGDLLYSVQTGKTNWDKIYGEPVFKTLFETNRELGDIFNRAMTSYSHQTIPAILASYDFSDAGTVADIAGGFGHLLGAVLQKYPTMKGLLFEVPTALEGAPAMLASYDAADRVELVTGDFWGEIPVKADVYMLKHIIHDWNDDQCKTILGNIRSVMPDDARMLIIDAVIPGPNEPHFAKFLDLEMLMLPGGMERTAVEFETLLATSGFRMTRIVPTPSPISIVEAVKV